MNERLMFRIWDKQEKKYLENKGFDYIDYAITKTGDLILIASENSDYCHVYIDKNRYVIEFCTGFKDKNGKLIFEGDITKITDKSSRKEPFIGVVEYTNTASYEANCNGFYMYLHDPKTPENISMIEKMFCTSLREIEVIGNIHENPELLENTNE